MHSLPQRGLIGFDSRYPEIEAVGGLFIVPADADPDEVRTAVVADGVRALELTDGVRDLDLITGLPLEFLFVLAPLPEITPVNTLYRLRSLALSASWTGQLEIERLPALEWFGVTEIERGQFQQLTRSAHERLSRVSISHFREPDLRGFAALPALTHLDVGYSRSLRSVLGVGDLPELRSLELWSCPALATLDGVQAAPDLEVLRLENCNRITDLELVSRLPRLRALMLDMRKPPSLEPLASHPSLEIVWLVGGKRPAQEMRALLENPAITILQSSRELWIRTDTGWLHIRDIYAMRPEEQSLYEEMHARRWSLMAW